MTTTALRLPSAAAIAAAVAQLTAEAQGNQKRIDAITRAQYDLAMGTRIAVVPGAFLVPSSSRSGLIHRVDHVAGCSCEAGRNNRECRHKVAIQIIERAQTRAIPSVISLSARIAAQRKAQMELDECFA